MGRGAARRTGGDARARPAMARPSASTPPTASPAWRAAAYAREADPGSTILEMNGFSTPRTTPSVQRRPTTVLREERKGGKGGSM